MNRRDVLLAGAAAAAAPVLTTTAVREAAANQPAAGKQAPGVHRMKLGAFELININDGGANRPIEGLIRNAPLAEVQAALEEAFLPKETFGNTFNPIVVNTGSRLVLLDTGNGQFGAPTTGRLLEGLAAAGIDPKAINTVLISHFHGDHIGGLRNKEGQLVFPNAEIMVPAAEWAFWMDDAKMAAAPDGMKGGFQNARRVFGPNAADVKRFEPGQELVTGIQAVAAYGHTPGHTAFAIQSDNRRIMYIADTSNNPALFVRRPDWVLSFDMDAEMARATRVKLLDMAAAERTLIAGYHFPFPSHGYVAKEGAGFRYVAAPWNPLL